MVASSGSVSGIGGIFLPPLKRDDTLSMALLSWFILAFRVCLVLCISIWERSGQMQLLQLKKS